MKKLVLLLALIFLTTQAWAVTPDRRISDNDGHVIDLKATGAVSVEVAAIMASIDVVSVSSESGYVQILDTTQNDDVQDTSSSVFVGNSKKVGFIVKTAIDWTDSNPDVSTIYTFETSPDNSTWVSMDIVSAYSTTPIASVTHSTAPADTDATSYSILHLTEGFPTQFVRMIADPQNADADDTSTVDVWLTYQK